MGGAIGIRGEGGGMAKMNWDRVRWENRAARSMDYTARMDAADERAELEAVFDAMRWEARQGSKPASKKVTPKRPRKVLPAMPATGTREREDLEIDAAFLGLTPAEEWRRRHGAPPATQRTVVPPAQSRQAGMTKAEQKRVRDAAEATNLGISIDELLKRRRSEAARQFALHEEAERRGITVKELRRLISEGVIDAPIATS